MNLLSNYVTLLFAVFEVFDPAAASSWRHSDSASVSGAQLTTGFHYVPHRDLGVRVSQAFNVSVDIRDLTSGLKLADIAWKVGERSLDSINSSSNAFIVDIQKSKWLLAKPTKVFLNIRAVLVSNQVEVLPSVVTNTRQWETVSVSKQFIAVHAQG